MANRKTAKSRKKTKNKRSVSKKTVRKASKRAKTPYPGLNPRVTSKIRQEYLDIDYADKLTPEEKQWYSNFMDEELGANFNHKGEILNKTEEDRRRCYNNNNARNRCTFSNSKAQGRLIYSDYAVNADNDDPNDCLSNPTLVEEQAVDELDKKKD